MKLNNPIPRQYAANILTHDTTLATGTIVVTNLGFRPRFIILEILYGSARCFGAINPDGTVRAVYRDQAGTLNQLNELRAAVTGGVTQQGYSLSSFDADGFTLANTKTGVPAGNAYFAWQAFD